MDAGEMLETLPIAEWRGPFPAAACARVATTLEAGRVVFLPNLSVPLDTEERRLLAAGVDVVGGKNVSYDSYRARLSNARLAEPDATRLATLMRRFSASATELLGALVPAWAGVLEPARTSYRPVEVSKRRTSLRHDDRLLHVDSFPSTPLRGRRILRLFSNVSTDNTPRRWQIGEPFEAFAARFAGAVRPQLPGSAWLLAHFGLTRGRRSGYDHAMLRLHDLAKRDAAYQNGAPRAVIDFPSGSSWVCFTDQVIHAAVAGRGALEQTFYLPVSALAEPGRAPLGVLERLGRLKLI